MYIAIGQVVLCLQGELHNENYFWNTHKNKKINSILCDIMEEHRIDIAVLAEYEDDSQKFIQEKDAWQQINSKAYQVGRMRSGVPEL